MKAHNCQARRYGDQLICAPCGLTWDADDPEPPECRPHIKRGIAEVAKFEAEAAPLPGSKPKPAPRLPDTLPADVAAEMEKAYQHGGMQAAYRVLLDRIEL